jgi:hypothetical protein
MMVAPPNAFLTLNITAPLPGQWFAFLPDATDAKQRPSKQFLIS